MIDEMVEYCECYSWQRKLTAVSVGAVIAVALYFLLRVEYDWLISLIACLIVGCVFAISYYVIVSESYCSDIFDTLCGNVKNRITPHAEYI